MEQGRGDDLVLDQKREGGAGVATVGSNFVEPGGCFDVELCVCFVLRTCFSHSPKGS